MYQVIIIDDEPVVREGIKQLISWKDYHFEICTEGFDGRDGLKKILEWLPDLVLVDVKMPGMSGIELIREAKKEGFDGKFIILTGYSDFDFAKSAISLGVRAYLLKPIDENELLDNVHEVMDELDSKKHLDDYYTLSELKARQEVLHRLLLYGGDKEELRREIKLYDIDFKFQCFSAVILSSKVPITEQNASLYHNKKEIILKDLSHIEQIMVDDKLVIINKGNTQQELLQTLIKNNERVKRCFGADFFICIGHTVANWEDIHFSYECAKLLMDYEFLYKDRGVVSIDIFDMDQRREDSNSVIRLCNMVEVGDIYGITAVLREWKELFITQLHKESEIKVLVIQYMIILQNLLVRSFEERKMHLPNFNKLSEGIKKVECLEDLMELVVQYCIEASECMGIASADKIVKRMYAYMEKNYDKDLKLENIGKIFNYNSAYLGKIFKKEMGESFHNVLDSIRIENAKRLLIQSDLKVYQISEQVGYGNTDYFHSKFKKYVGISPKEFKSK